MLTIILIALVIYLLVMMNLPVRLPHPGLQATVDVFKAVRLKDADVVRTAREYIRYMDAKYGTLPLSDSYAGRLERLTKRYETVNRVPLNFAVYHNAAVNAFATADGSIRVFSGLMDRMTDDELMAIVGHEMGHIRNSDTIGAMRKAYLTSAVRGALSVAGGALAGLSGSQLGSLAEKYAGAQFSQRQEFGADDFSFGFLVRNGYGPGAMASALAKLHELKKEKNTGDALLRHFSTHPDTLRRVTRIRARAEAYVRRLAETNEK